MNQALFFSESRHSPLSSPPFFPNAQSCPQLRLPQMFPRDDAAFPNMDQFKVFPCHLKKQHNHKQCIFYHSPKDQRRSNRNFNEEICFFVLNNQECQLGDDCPFSHNQVEERYMPRNYKKKFCYYFEIGKVENCEYGNFCSYAHSEQEISIELLHKMKEDERFFIYRFKTVMCPFFNLKHDKGTCVYAHNFQDFRRRPDQFSYEMKPCLFWKYDAYVHVYEDGCPNGMKCDKCHGWKELDFHPLYYKTLPCPNSGRCYKNFLCPFFHNETEQRNTMEVKTLRQPTQRMTPKTSSIDAFKKFPKKVFKEDLMCLKTAECLTEENNEISNNSTESYKSNSNGDSFSECKATEKNSLNSTKKVKNLENIDFQVYKSLFYN